MTAPTTVRLRTRRLASLAGPAGVVRWQPMVAAGLGAVALVALGSPDGVPFRLSVAGACLAASGAYVIDDPGAVTVAASPTSLLVRRAVRTATAAAGVSIGWIAALSVSSLRVSVAATWPGTLQVTAFLALALAVSAVAASTGDGTEGAIAGVVVTMACFASTLLRGIPWLPFPPDPAAPGGAGRLLLVLTAAILALAFASRDPAARARPLQSDDHRDTRQGDAS